MSFWSLHVSIYVSIQALPVNTAGRDLIMFLFTKLHVELGLEFERSSDQGSLPLGEPLQM